MSPDVRLVDDHLLLRILIGEVVDDIDVTDRAVATTGLWYHRLARALANPRVAGAMTGRLADADPGLAGEVLRAVTELPAGIELMSMRKLAWPMATLIESGVRLNLMSLEALAAAEHLSATICLAVVDANPPLIDAARQRGVEVRLFG